MTKPHDLYNSLQSISISHVSMNRFGGKSSLRKKDEEEPPPGPSQKQLELQAYLAAKYSSKPSKKKKKAKTTTQSLRIVDSDISGFAPVEESIVKEAGHFNGSF